MILTLIIHWLGPLLSLPWGFETTLAVWGERRAKDPCQKNTPLVVRLKRAVYGLRVRAFYQLSYPGLKAIPSPMPVRMLNRGPLYVLDELSSNVM